MCDHVPDAVKTGIPVGDVTEEAELVGHADGHEVRTGLGIVVVLKPGRCANRSIGRIEWQIIVMSHVCSIQRNETSIQGIWFRRW